MKKIIEINVPDGYREIVNNSDNKIVIEFIKDNKENEMKQFLLSFINGAEIVIKPEFPNSVFYKKNNEIIFELEKSKNENKTYFWVNYHKIWKIFENKFGLNYDDIQSFIKNEVEDTLKCGTVTPIVS